MLFVAFSIVEQEKLWGDGGEKHEELSSSMDGEQKPALVRA